MCKILFFALLLLFVFAACRKKNDNDNCNLNQYRYTYRPNAQVDTLRNGTSSPLVATVNSGNKLVFTYTYYNSPCQVFIDGGDGETLVFEVDPAATSFNYFSSDLAAAKCYYQQQCDVCPYRDAYIPLSGTVEGMLNGKQWNVHADLKLDSSGHTLRFSGTFTPAQ